MNVNDYAHLKFAYERRADEMVLLMQTQDNEIDELDSQILSVNTIPHLLPVALHDHDTRISLEFNLGSRKPLSEWLRTQHISDERLLHFLLHVSDMLWRLRDYLLIENRLLLLPEAMYIKDQLLDVKFVYWPDKQTKPDEQRVAQQLKHLILRITKHGESRKVVRTVMNYCDDPSFTIGSFRKRLLVWLDQTSDFSGIVDEQHRNGGVDSTSSRIRRARIWLDSFIRRLNKAKQRRVGTAGYSANGNSNRTISLVDRSSAVLNEASLSISQQGKEPHKIMIHETPYVIGRDQQAVNLVIEDIQVSRMHAEIKRTEGGYIIRDLGSRNGTRLNEQELTPFTDYKLQDKDKIQLGDARYQFQLEQGKSMV